MSNKDIDRFLGKIEKTKSCWLWLGSRSGKGYGSFWLNGRKRPASQVAWSMANKQSFPSGMFACHTCDNPKCVNPDHIFVGTPKDNTQDAILKNRFKPVPKGHRGLWQKAKTHCIHGHEFNFENTIIRSNGCRGCLACRRITEKNRPPRNRGKNVTSKKSDL